MKTGHVYLSGRCCCGKREPIIRRWLDSWSVSEQEPTWPQVIVAGVLFVGSLVAIYMSVLLIWAVLG